MNRPLLLGHRGCRLPGLAENTVPALEHALASGCDGFEFDVRYTADGRAVLEHELFWNRLPISATNHRDLVTKDGDRPAGLDEVLQQFGGRAFLDIELKVEGNEAHVLSALHNQPAQSKYLVTSFLPPVLARVRNADDRIPLGFLLERTYAFRVAWSMPVQYLLPRHDLVDKELIDKAHERGMKVMTWTVNRRDDMLRLADWSIDGIISDDPQLLYQTFHST